MGIYLTRRDGTLECHALKKIDFIYLSIIAYPLYQQIHSQIQRSFNIAYYQEQKFT